MVFLRDPIGAGGMPDHAVNLSNSTSGPIPMYNWSTIEDIAGPSPCEWFIFLVTGVLAAIFFVIGMVGNILGLLILSRVELASTTFFLLKCLACSEIFFLFTYVVSVSIPEIIFFFEGMASLQYLNYINWWVYPVASMGLTVSTWIMVLLTVYRYLAVKVGCRHKRFVSLRCARIEVAVLVLVSIAIGLSKYWESRIVHVEVDGGHRVIVEGTSLWFNNDYQLYYRMIFMTVIRKIVPLIIVTIFTYLQVSMLSRWRKVRANSLDKPGSGGSQANVSRVLIAIAVIFVICQSPMAVYPVIRMIFPENNHHPCSIYGSLATFADSLVLLNAAINFYIFYPFIPMFRNTLNAMCCSGPEVEESTSRTSSLKLRDRNLTGTSYLSPEVVRHM